MVNTKQMRISIGRFSKMTRLSVKALRLYDAQGLLSPAQVDPSSGYRYYHLGQSQQAEVIRVLRSIDMPLADIKRMVESEGDAAISEQLQQHKTRLVEKLAEQEAALTYLERMIKNQEIIRTYRFELSEEASKRIAAVKLHTSISNISTDIRSGFATLMQGLGQAGILPSAAPMILYHNIIDQESEGDIEIAVPVTTAFTNAGGVYERELEASTMATTVHRGPYQEIAPAYRALTHWVFEQGYEIAGPTREIYVNDPQSVASDDLLTRLEFPVHTKASEAQ